VGAFFLPLRGDRQPLVELVLCDFGVADLGDGARGHVVATGDEGNSRARQGERQQEFEGDPCQSGGEG
jgi:hypothetical protein